MKKKSKGKNQYIKSKLRTTKEWRQFRIDIEDYYEIDQLTHKKLLKGWNNHHMDMRVENYDKLIIERFRPFNKSSHDLIHVLYRYYEKDPDILTRLKNILDDMVRMNND